MVDSPPSDKAALKALYIQIEEMYAHFKKIRGEAAGIVQNSQMPDAALHLNDVLKATEDATMAILDAATNINSEVEVSGAAQACKSQVAAHVGIIYEACSFQDISGQRIRKVLDHLNELEIQLFNLSETVKDQNKNIKPKDSLLNGPQLAAVAPNQAEIDAMFKMAGN